MHRHNQKRASGIRIHWRRFFPTALAVAVIVTAYSAAPAIADVAKSPLADEGRRIFESLCIACHTIGRGVLIGPDLQGVTDRREASWMRAHIQSPSLHRERNDPVALALLQQFRVPMPDLGLTERQVEAVVAHLKAPETARAVPAAPAMFVPTLLAGVLAIAGLTLIGIKSGTKKVEVRQ